MTATSLSTCSWPQVRGRVLVVPVGSCEQHGPHLPFDVDACIASSVCNELDSSPDVVLAPALNYGSSGEHEGFPGTISIGTEALHNVVVELGRSAAQWAERLLFVNGHGGNLDALDSAVRQLRGERRDAAWWPCAPSKSDAHAGRTETSLMLALRPASVQLAHAACGVTTPIAELLDRLRAEGTAGVSSTGVLGDPRGASAEEGARLLADLGRRLRSAVSAWQVGHDGRLGPGG